MRRSILVALATLVPAASAQAQAGGANNVGVYTKVLTHYQEQAHQWAATFHGAAYDLFVALALVSLTWTLVQLLTKRADLAQMGQEIILHACFTGFWLMMLNLGPSFAQEIWDGILSLGGAKAAGGSLEMPVELFDMGFLVLARACDVGGFMDVMSALPAILIATGFMVITTLLTGEVIVVMVTFWMAAKAGLIVLGFGASHWTNDMARGYYKMVLGLALHATGLYMIVASGSAILGEVQSLDGAIDMHGYTVLLATAILMYQLAKRFPPQMAALATGGGMSHQVADTGAGMGMMMALAHTRMAQGAQAMASRAMMGTAKGAGKLAGRAALVGAGLTAGKIAASDWAAKRRAAKAGSGAAAQDKWNWDGGQGPAGGPGGGPSGPGGTSGGPGIGGPGSRGLNSERTTQPSASSASTPAQSPSVSAKKGDEKSGQSADAPGRQDKTEGSDEQGSPSVRSNGSGADGSAPSDGAGIPGTQHAASGLGVSSSEQSGDAQGLASRGGPPSASPDGGARGEGASQGSSERAGSSPAGAPSRSSSGQEVSTGSISGRLQAAPSNSDGTANVGTAASTAAPTAAASSRAPVRPRRETVMQDERATQQAPVEAPANGVGAAEGFKRPNPAEPRTEATLHQPPNSTARPAPEPPARTPSQQTPVRQAPTSRQPGTPPPLPHHRRTAPAHLEEEIARFVQGPLK